MANAAGIANLIYQAAQDAGLGVRGIRQWRGRWNLWRGWSCAKTDGTALVNLAVAISAGADYYVAYQNKSVAFAYHSGKATVAEFPAPQVIDYPSVQDFEKKRLKTRRFAMGFRDHLRMDRQNATWFAVQRGEPNPEVLGYTWPYRNCAGYAWWWHDDANPVVNSD